MLTAVAALLLVAPGAAPGAAEPPPPLVTLGTHFSDAPLDTLLDRARQSHQALVLLFVAADCEECDRLDTTVLSTARGTALSERSLAARWRIETPDSRALVQRFSILTWPTTVVLRPAGSEIGRIEGFTDPRAYLGELAALLDGKAPSQACEQRLQRDRSDVAALYCVAKAQLDRGRARDAMPMLEEVLVRDPRNRHGVTDRALFAMARYFAFVQRQPRQARHYFRELDARFADTPAGAEAAWWYARSLHHIEMTELGWLYLVQNHERRASAASAYDLGRYALYGKVHRSEALKAVQRAARQNPRHAGLARLSDELGQAILQP